MTKHNWRVMARDKAAATAVDRFIRQYRNSPAWAPVIERLSVSGITADQIDDAIGNKSWTQFWCSGCHDYHAHAVEFGEDYSVQLCERCLSGALRDLRRSKKDRP